MRLWREIREFGSFFLGLWGALAGFSVLFPLANTLGPALPLYAAYADLATGLATLTCFFAIVYSFAERHRLRTALRNAGRAPQGWEPENSALRAALTRFGWAMACFALYLILDVVHRWLGGQSGELVDLAISLFTPLTAIVYSLLFGLLTGAFGELAVIEYVKGQSEEKPLGAAGHSGRH